MTANHPTHAGKFYLTKPVFFIGFMGAGKPVFFSRSR